MTTKKIKTWKVVVAIFALIGIFVWIPIEDLLKKMRKWFW